MRRGLRFSDAEARALMRAAGAEPVDPYPGAARPEGSVCSYCGEECCPCLISARRVRAVRGLLTGALVEWTRIRQLRIS